MQKQKRLHVRVTSQLPSSLSLPHFLPLLDINSCIPQLKLWRCVCLGVPSPLRFFLAFLGGIINQYMEMIEKKNNKKTQQILLAIQCTVYVCALNMCTKSFLSLEKSLSQCDLPSVAVQIKNDTMSHLFIAADPTTDMRGRHETDLSYTLHNLCFVETP